MPGPPPQLSRTRSVAPARGDWSAAPGVGWQHGDIPAPPPRLSAKATEAWRLWFTSWVAAHWGPEDVPMLELTVQLYAKCYSGRATGAERSEYRQMADGLGISKKGQQDRRWRPPEAAPVGDEKPSRFANLRVVNE